METADNANGGEEMVLVIDWSFCVELVGAVDEITGAGENCLGNEVTVDDDEVERVGLFGVSPEADTVEVGAVCDVEELDTVGIAVLAGVGVVVVDAFGVDLGVEDVVVVATSANLHFLE